MKHPIYVRGPQAALLAVLGCLAAAPAQSTRRVSVDAQNNQLPSGAIWTELAENGRFVAFTTPDAVVPGDTNGVADAYVKDLITGAVVRASLTASGVQPNGHCFQPKLSADGRFVCFSSLASNLAASDGNGTQTDVFVKDLQTGALEHVSRNNAGAGGNGVSAYPEISADGTTVVFYSYASNLVANDTNSQSDTFLFDRTTQQIECLSRDANGVPVFGQLASVSGDGRFVAFETVAAAAGQPPSAGSGMAIALRDRVLGTVTAVNLQGGVLMHATVPAIAADGNTVMFGTSWSLDPADTDNARDVYVVDRVSGTRSLMSPTTAGSATGCHVGGLSRNGRFVLFSSAEVFDAADGNDASDVFLVDRATGALERVSVGAAGATGDAASASGSVSANGRFVAFSSAATNLVAGDTNAANDVFVRDRCPSATAQLYGSGFPGTAGQVPAFGLLGLPAIGSTPALAFGNTAGVSTVALVVLGGQALALPTPVLGTLLVQPDVVQALLLPPTGLVLPIGVPDVVDLCGVQLFVQALQLDAGAAAGVAFSRGLQLTIGG